MDLKKMIFSLIFLTFSTINCVCAEKILIGMYDFNLDGTLEKIYMSNGINKNNYVRYTNMEIVDVKTKQNIFLPKNNICGNVGQYTDRPRVIGKYIYLPSGKISYNESFIDFIVYGFDEKSKVVCPLYTKNLEIKGKISWNEVFEKAKKTPAKPFYFYRTILRAMMCANENKLEEAKEYFAESANDIEQSITILKNNKISDILLIAPYFSEDEKKLVFFFKNNNSFWTKLNLDGTKIEILTNNREFDRPR